MTEPKTFTADDFEPMDFDAMPPDVRDWRKADLCLFKLYCATENTRDADEAYEAIVELSKILVRRGITRFVFDKPVKANPNGYYAKLFREMLFDGGDT